MKEHVNEHPDAVKMRALQQVFASIACEGFFLVSKDWLKFLFISESMERETGIAVESLRSSPKVFLDALHHDDRENMLSAAALAAPIPDCRIVLPGGTRWISLHIQIIPDFEGESCYAGSVTDITSRKNAELTLMASEKRYRNLIENVQDVIYQCDLQGNITMVSPRIRDILGYEPGYSFIGVNIPDQLYYDPGDREKLLTIMAEKGEVTDFETRLRKKDGSPIVVSANIHFYRDDGGKIAGVEGYVRDITAQKKAEDLFNRAFHQNPCAMTVSEIETGKIREVNKAWLRQQEWARDEVIGRTSLELGLFADPEDRKKIITELKTTGHITGTEVDFITRTGKRMTGLFYGEIIEVAGSKALLSAVINITPLREAENELMIKNAILAAEQDASLDGILVVDSEAKILIANRRFAEIWNIPDELAGCRDDEKILGTVLEQVVTPEAFLEKVRYLYDNIQDASSDEILLKDGRCLERYAAPITGKTGEYLGRVWYFRDITERKKNELLLRNANDELVAANEELTASNEEFEAINEELVSSYSELAAAQKKLAASEKDYRTLIENLTSGLFIFDAADHLPLVNPAGVRITGISSDGKSSSKVFLWHEDGTEIPPEELPSHVVFRTGRAVRNAVIGLSNSSDGEKRWTLSDTYPEFDSEGKIKRVISSSVDISELKKAEERILNLKNSMTDILDSIPDMLVGIDSELRTVFINRPAELFSGVTIDDAAGKPADIILADFSSSISGMRESIAARRIETFSGLRVEKNGESRYYDLMCYPLSGRNSGQAVIRISDITAAKRKDDQLRQAQKMETIGTLAGGLAHDFNNVLGGIVGTVSLIENIIAKDDTLNRRFSEYISIIDRSGKRAAEMVRQLLTLSRKSESSVQLIDLNAAVEHVMQICRNTFDKSIEIVAEYAPKPATITGDLTQVEQIILNLCVNAAHSMTIMRSPDEIQGGTLTLSVKHILADSFFCGAHAEAHPGWYWMISHSDTGVGMDDATKHKIFDPFFTTKDKDKGTGLGLAMAYSIIHQHKGFIDVYSEKGSGSTLNIYFPENRAPAEADKKKEMEKTEKGSGLILVIDDEEIMRLIAQKMLNECGYDVILAENGREGISQFSQNARRITAVLLDMAMPGMSGKEVYLELKKIDPEVKVLLSSGFRHDSRAEEGLSLGINGFIQKPYSLAELSRKIRDITEYPVWCRAVVLNRQSE